MVSEAAAGVVLSPHNGTTASFQAAKSGSLSLGLRRIRPAASEQRLALNVRWKTRRGVLGPSFFACSVCSCDVDMPMSSADTRHELSPPLSGENEPGRFPSRGPIESLVMMIGEFEEHQ